MVTSGLKALAALSFSYSYTETNCIIASQNGNDGGSYHQARMPASMENMNIFRDDDFDLAAYENLETLWLWVELRSEETMCELSYGECARLYSLSPAQQSPAGVY